MIGKVSKTKLLGLLVVIAALALVVACGEDEPTAAPTAAPTATSAPAATTAPAPTTAPEATTAPAPTTAPAATAMPAPTATTAPAPTATEAMPEPTATEAMMDRAKEVIKFHDGQWGSLWAHNAVAMYIVEVGYGYPVEEIQGTTGTMQVTLPEGDVHVNMELWRANVLEWYRGEIEKGTVMDLAGTVDNVENGAKGQILEISRQGFYVPTYVIEGDAERGIEASAPDLKSVMDLPQYAEVFGDPSDPGKGAVLNCIIGWSCQKINRAKWHAYGLYDTYNVIEPGGSAALKAGIVSAYEAGEPVLAYYWEPTDVVDQYNLTLLEEPEYNAECHEMIQAAIQEEPYESEVGCEYEALDVHSAIHAGLAERAPEVVEFLSNLFIGALPIGELEAWQAENDAEWVDVAIMYLKDNRDVWTTWITDDNAEDIIAKVDAELARED